MRQQHRSFRRAAVALVAVAATTVSCGSTAGSEGSGAAGADDRGTEAVFDPANFVDPTLDTNPYHPLEPGLQWVRGGTTEVGSRTIPPVLVLTRDPVADRIGSVVVAALTRTTRGLVSELELTVTDDGVPSDCIVNFDNIHTIRRDSFRRCIATLSPHRMAEACQRLRDATGC